jgi:hypothetical protein
MNYAQKQNDMNAKEKVRWLNARDPLQKWSVGEDVYCLHCDGVFKVDDVSPDYAGYPECPVCHGATPIDFHKLPWWRDDLVEQTATKYRMVNTWRVEPIRATLGHPSTLPPLKKCC